MIAKLIRGLITVGPSLKRWIFSDGKFQTKRAIILLVSMVLLMIGYHFIPHEMTAIIDSLDKVSDMIGYAE